MSLVEDLAAAIARFEGYYKPGSLAQRNNNPGNLRSWGDYPVVDGYAQFPDPETGWRALRRQVELNIGRGLNLNEFFSGKPGVYPGYAPAADANNPRHYAATVAGWLGISPDVPLAAVNPLEPVGSSPSLPALELPGPDVPAWLPFAAVAVGAVSIGVLLFSD